MRNFLLAKLHLHSATCMYCGLSDADTVLMLSSSAWRLSSSACIKGEPGEVVLLAQPTARSFSVLPEAGLQGAAHLKGDPLDRVPFEKLENEVDAVWGKLGPFCQGNVNLMALYISQELYVVAPIKGGLPNQQLIQNDPHTPQICLQGAAQMTLAHELL